MTDYERHSLAVMCALGNAITNLTNTISAGFAKIGALPPMAVKFDEKFLEQLEQNNANQTQWTEVLTTVQKAIADDAQRRTAKGSVGVMEM